MFNKRFFTMGILIFFALVSLVGCYGCGFGAPVGENQVGLDLNDGVSITNILPPGRHSNMSFLADLKTVNVGAVTYDWNDDSLATKDKQSIGLTAIVTVKRKGDSESVKAMYDNFQSEMFNDEALGRIVVAKMGEAAKSATVKKSIGELLGTEGEGGRAELAIEIENNIKPELDKFYVEVVDISISDIRPSEAYRETMELKAKSQGQKELAEAEKLRLETQLLSEEMTTKIELEKAKREAAVAEAKASVYETSPQTLELKRLELLNDVIGANDKIIFVPVGSDISTIFNTTDVTTVPEVVTASPSVNEVEKTE